MADGGEPERRPRRGPAPIASFDCDVSDESSPETKQPARLPEIREEASAATCESRGRSPSVPAGGGLPAPRIDISRASSSSHQDSRDSSPELALFSGGAGPGEEPRARLELAFREDGALDLRSSTEELAFLEDEPRPAPVPPPAPLAGPAAPPSRRHSRKDSQSSEAALLAVSGRTSRLSSVGSQCSALSGLSRASRLSVASGASRSPSPHKMLLETSFCGPRPIETDPEVCAAAVEERLLEIAKLTAHPAPPVPAPAPDARDRREVRTEVTVETPRAPIAAPALSAAPAPAAPAPPLAPAATVVVTPAPEQDKLRKETANEVRAERRRARPKLRREPSEPEVYKHNNRTKDVIRIKLKPDEDYGEEMEVERASGSVPAQAVTSRAARPTELADRVSPGPAPRESRTPSPGAPSVSRKSSFCSLFKSRETIASPDSPSEALRRKRSLTEGGTVRSKSRDRAATPSSTGKLRGSVLSLFRTSRRSVTSPSPSPSTREGSPVVQPRVPPACSPCPASSNEKLKYYEESRDGVIHIPLRTPPEERISARRQSEGCSPPRDPPRPASAPTARTAPGPLPEPAARVPWTRTVLPDGSILIPLRSPTERVAPGEFPASCDRVLSPLEPVTPQTPPVESRAAADGAEASPAREPAAPATAPVPTPVATLSPVDTEVPRKPKERIVFTTHVGSREQLFSTQFSITKTPSVASEISGSFPSFDEGEATVAARAAGPEVEGPSSESEGSSEGGGGGARVGSDVERRGLVVQDSFEEELPYVPTTLPLERSVALPMVPVRERGGVRVAALQRPRGTPPAGAPRAPPPGRPAPVPAPLDKLRIRLPHRPAGAGPSRARSRSGGDGAESRPKEWIDFEEVPERRKQPKRIQTLPAAAATTSGAGASAGAGAGAGAGGVVFSYVEPEQCRCECHGHRSAPPEHAAAPARRTQLTQLEAPDHILADATTGGARC